MRSTCPHWFTGLDFYCKEKPQIKISNIGFSTENFFMCDQWLNEKMPENKALRKTVKKIGPALPTSVWQPCFYYSVLCHLHGEYRKAGGGHHVWSGLSWVWYEPAAAGIIGILERGNTLHFYQLTSSLHWQSISKSISKTKSNNLFPSIHGHCAHHCSTSSSVCCLLFAQH